MYKSKRQIMQILLNVTDNEADFIRIFKKP